MIYITRREVFNAAHRVFNKDWSDEKNLEVYGKCANPNWHGHNYNLYITIKGNIRQDTGYVADLKSVSAIIREKIIAGAVDELTSKMMVEKRVEYLINNFEQRLKEIASNYIKVPAKIPTDLLVKSVIYGRANWEILKKQLTDNEKESIYNRALASVKEVSPAAGVEDIMRKPKIIFGRKT